jgi:transcription-repair coupling factor (superfamily II helicase)
VDRFGVLPDPAKNLFRIARLRIAAARLGIERLDIAPAGGSVTFGEPSPIDPGALILLVQRSSRTMRFDGPNKLRFSGRHEQPEERFAAAQTLLVQLGKCAGS